MVATTVSISFNLWGRDWILIGCSLPRHIKGRIGFLTISTKSAVVQGNECYNPGALQTEANEGHGHLFAAS